MTLHELSYDGRGFVSFDVIMYLIEIRGEIWGEGNAFPSVLLCADLPFRAGAPRNAPASSDPQNTTSPLKPHPSFSRRLSRVFRHLPLCLEHRCREVRLIF